MFKKVLIAFVAAALSLPALAQGTGEKSAEKHLEKRRFAKAYVLLKRSVLRDSGNVRAPYLLARYFFTPANPDFNIDSAHRYYAMTLRRLRQISSAHHDRSHRHQTDSAIVLRLGNAIDSAAFYQAATINTFDAMQHYLDVYHGSVRRDSAVILRDEAAFRRAVAIGSVEVFERFIADYPSAHRRADADRELDRLRFIQATSDQQLSSYVRFLGKYPETQFLPEIEKRIFELSTASGDAEAFRNYLQKYPNSSQRSAAENILTYLQDQALDSVKLGEFLYPVLTKEGQFAFINALGAEKIKPFSDQLPKSYRCGFIKDDVLAFDKRLINNDGMVIWDDHYQGFVEAGSGFIFVEQDEKVSIVHRSGQQFFTAGYDDARMLNGKVIAVKSGKWGLASLSGWQILPYEWDDINSIGDILVFAKQGKLNLTTIAQVTQTTGEKPKWMDNFDEVKKLSPFLIWVRSGSYEGILDSALQISVRLEKHSITPQGSGFLIHSPSGFSFVNHHHRESEVVERIAVQEPWVILKKSGKWTLADTETLNPLALNFDTVQLLGPFAAGYRQDTVRIFADGKNILTFQSGPTLEFLPQQGDKGYLLIHEKEKKSVFNSEGTKLFTGVFDRIQPVGTDCFVVQKKDRNKKDRKGLVNVKGREILPVEYDAIGGPVEGVVALLKDKRFGQFELKSNVLIKPEYDKNIQVYAGNVYVAFKNGKLGLIDGRNKPMTAFEFESVHYWRDSVALVQKEKSWQLLDIYTARPVDAPFSEIHFIRDDEEEKLCRVKQGNSYGVISNHRGTVIPVKFTDLVNVGSPRKPIFFTEKHVEEASLFVVIYYDDSGTFIRREVYEHDDYERIYCAE